MTVIDYLSIALIVGAWLVCGLGMWSFYVAEFPNPNPAQVIFVIFAWPGVLFVFGLVIFAGALVYFATWLGTAGTGLRSVDYKIAFSNSLKNVFKDRFFWGSLIGSIIGGIYVDSDLDFWVLIFMFLVVFLVVGVLTDGKNAE